MNEQDKQSFINGIVAKFNEAINDKAGSAMIDTLDNAFEENNEDGSGNKKTRQLFRCTIALSKSKPGGYDIEVIALAKSQTVIEGRASGHFDPEQPDLPMDGDSSDHNED